MYQNLNVRKNFKYVFLETETIMNLKKEKYISNQTKPTRIMRSDRALDVTNIAEQVPKDNECCLL